MSPLNTCDNSPRVCYQLLDADCATCLQVPYQLLRNEKFHGYGRTHCHPNLFHIRMREGRSYTKRSE